MTTTTFKILPIILFIAGIGMNLSLFQPGSRAAVRDSASLTVLVTRTNGAPISGAAVCVAAGSGTARSAVTGAGGQTTFNEVSSGQVTITVSCSGFTGQTHTSTLPAAGGTARFLLSDGSGGPVCTVTPQPPSKTPATLAITSFDWHVNRRTPLFFEVALAFAATRTPGGPVVPTQYRVGESSDLSNTHWIDYQGGVALFQLRYRENSLTAYGQRTLYLQLKQGDVASPVAAKSVDLRPVQTGEFRLTENALSDLLNLIAANGFSLGIRTVSATQNHCASAQLQGLGFAIPNGYLPDRVWEKIVEVSLVESSTKKFTPGWRVKSIEIADSQELDAAVARTIAGRDDGTGFRVVIHLSVGPRKLVGDNPCLSNVFPLHAIVLEGPADDMALDQAKRWKNMFPSH